MRIKMITLAAGPDGTYLPGQEVDLPESLAQAYIDAGAAEPLARKQVETAAVEPGEKAVKPAPNRRKRGK